MHAELEEELNCFVSLKRKSSGHKSVGARSISHSARELSEVVNFLLGFLTTTTKPNLLVFFITCAKAI